MRRERYKKELSMSVSAKINNAVDMDDLDSALELAEAWVKNDQNVVV